MYPPNSQQPPFPPDPSQQQPTAPWQQAAPQSPAAYPGTAQRVYSSGPAQNCAYCGAPLNPFYYFCLCCATPYQYHNNVVSAVRPVTLSDEARIAKLAPHAWTLFFSYLGALFVCIIIIVIYAVFTRGKMDSGVTLIVGSIVLFITTGIFAGIHWRPLLVQLKNPGFNNVWAWIGLGLLVPCLGINFLYHGMLFKVFGDKLREETVNDFGLAAPALVFLICFLPAVTEEIAFRGLLQYWLEIAIVPVRAILLAAALFAAMHLSFLSFPYLMLVGALLGLVRKKTNSLYPSMLIHFLHNLAVIAYAWLSSSGK
jgi:membrane protease YdiL (CAAX protease family)